MANFRRPYVAVTVTLTSANTNYNVLALVNAILAAETQGDNTMRAPGAARELSLQAHPGVDSVGGNTNDILVGDALLSATRIGYVLVAGSTDVYSSTIANVDLGSIHVRSAGAGQKLNVEIVMG